MRVRGEPITEAWLPDSIDVGITFSASMQEYLACTEAGLDYSKWEGQGEPYGRWLKARAIAGWMMKNLIHSHSEAAQAKAAKKKAK